VITFIVALQNPAAEFSADTTLQLFERELNFTNFRNAKSFVLPKSQLYEENASIGSIPICVDLIICPGSHQWDCCQEEF
jgi:hypothetical protein